MLTLETSKDNWSGETCKVVINEETGEFTIGMFLSLGSFVMKKDKPFDDDTTIYTVTHPDWPDFEWTGFGFSAINYKYQVTFGDCGVERSDSNPYLAFVKLAWNTI